MVVVGSLFWKHARIALRNVSGITAVVGGIFNVMVIPVVLISERSKAIQSALRRADNGGKVVGNSKGILSGLRGGDFARRLG